MKILAAIRQNSLFKNMSYLTVLQMTNYLFPLITYPYLYRVIGVANCGILALAQSVISYFVLLVNYGFYLSGPRLIAINRDDPAKVSETFSAILVIKSMLMVVGFVLVALLSFTVPVMRAHSVIYIVTTLSLVGEVIFPTWFFQGMEDMSFITVFSVISRFVALLLLIALVRSPADLVLACAIQVCSGVLAGIMAMVVVFRKYKVRLTLPTRDTFILYMRDNWNFFLAQFSTSIFSNANAVLLGFFVSYTAVSYYAAADKAVRMVVSLIQPVTTAIYPKATRLFAKSVDNALAFIKKALKYGTVFFFAASLALFLAAPLITWFMTGENIATVTDIIRILSILPTSIFINNMYGTQIMVNCGLEVKFRNIILFCGLTLIVSSLLFIQLFATIGAGLASLLAELLEAGLMMGSVERNKRLRLFGKAAVSR